MTIEHAESDEQIAATFDLMRQLRPHLTRDCGRLLYLDDLVADERVRSRGYGHRMLG